MPQLQRFLAALLLAGCCSIGIAQNVPSAVAGPQPSFQDLKKLVILRFVAPAYPPEAYSRQLHGRVVAEVVISESGNVERVEPTGGEAVFYPSAIAALRQWRFQPYSSKGKPSRVRTRIPVEFVLPERLVDTPSQTAPKRITASAKDSEGHLLTHIVPEYPALAKAAHRGGSVVLRVIVGSDGRVRLIDVVSGSPIFTQSAIEAVSRWRYKPFTEHGKAVEVDTIVTWQFYLPGS